MSPVPIPVQNVLTRNSAAQASTSPVHLRLTQENRPAPPSSYQNSRSADEDLGCSNIFERISIWGDTKFVSWAEADEPLVGTREAPLPPFGPRIPYSSALPPLV